MVTIAIANIKGGSGKTTIATNLAATANFKGQSATLIDSDPLECAKGWFKWRSAPTPNVVVSGSSRIAFNVRQAIMNNVKIVVIDTPPGNEEVVLNAAAVADIIIVPCLPNAIDLLSIKPTLGLIEFMKRDVYVVLIGGESNSYNYQTEACKYSQFSKVSLCPRHLPKRAVYRHASAEGRGVLEIEPGSKAAAEIEQFYDWLLIKAHRQYNSQE